jgi:transcriptional regulator NrdR family protein
MKCPSCGAKTSVIDSWVLGTQVLRIRECKDCKQRIQTRERRTVHEPHEGRWSK